jgi:hypothetical protein
VVDTSVIDVSVELMRFWSEVSNTATPEGKTVPTLGS